MKDLQISWGETLPFVITTNEETAATATLTINKVSGSFIYSKSASFVQNACDVSYAPQETQLDLGEYEYQLKITYTTGAVDKFPDLSKCEDISTFVFPKITITESLDMPGVS